MPSNTEQVKRLKTFGFGLSALRKKWELIPLVTIIGGACVGVSAFCVYAMTTKPDVVTRRGIPRFEALDPEKPVKLVTLNQQYRSIPELEKLRHEIGSFRS
ncbi:normal mucosa of esophagus-specific gene 1 protein-like isoform X2 [Tubulanus polymorphus]|uniref:normal mucosa of esophagus-specific gene 1 protein-like isoform X2 n=1 Tax=Tubulanus polymorphus TaxID=672921 RepID=UPI003DA66CAD